MKIFKISTKEMWTIGNKAALCDFIHKETGTRPDSKLAIFNLMQYLPRDKYYRVR